MSEFSSWVGRPFLQLWEKTDRLLKGRFYQALLVKWQRKLGPPCPDETFDDLFAQARMVEECERQFTASAESRPPNKHGKSNPKPKQAPKESKGNTSNSISQGEGSRSSRPPKQVRCFSVSS